MAIAKVLAVGRAYAALLDIAAHPKGEIPTAQLKDIVNSLLNVDPIAEEVRDRGMLSYRLERVFEQLAARPEVTLEELALLSGHSFSL